MTGWPDPHTLRSELVALGDRIGDLRAVRDTRPVDALEALDASLLELELAHEELRVCTDEIRSQDEEKARIGERPDLAVAAAFAGLPIPLLLVDRYGVVRQANRAAADALGRPLDRLVGLPFVLNLGPVLRRTFRLRLPGLLDDSASGALAGTLRGGAAVTLSLWPVGETGPRGPMIAVLISKGEPAAAPARPAAAPAPIDFDPDDLATGSQVRQIVREMAGPFADCVIVDLTCETPPHQVIALADDRLPGPAGVRIYESTTWRDWEKGRYMLLTGTPVLDAPIEDDRAIRQATGPVAGDWRALGGSLLGMPLRVGGEVCGAVTAVRGRAREPFGPEDWTRMRQISDELAGIVGGPDASPSPLRMLKNELLPAALPRIRDLEIGAAHRWLPPEAGVGGSFYDVFRARSAWWLLVADVPGRDRRALASLAMIRSVVRLLAGEHDDPAELLRALNAALLSDQEADHFATALVARLAETPGDPMLQLASAGHARAAVRDAEGSVWFARGGGSALGAFDDPLPVRDEIPLAMGDLVLLYGDAVMEARTGAGGVLGEEGLAATLAGAVGGQAGSAARHVEQRLRDLVPANDVVLLAVSRATSRTAP